ncbi:Uncharacterised protein [Mycobacteroides abscessus subsp. abscessus]|nr:Uncharacterised protein [Mycobacteroides abscessus subsp. abscessus]
MPEFGSGLCFLNQDSKVRPYARGMGAERCTPMTASIARRIGLTSSAQFAMGATGVIMVPIREVRPMRRSRSGMPCASFMAVRRWWMISVTFTPWGHTSEQVPHEEQ